LLNASARIWVLPRDAQRMAEAAGQRPTRHRGETP
jgi:hypothetical protein